MQLLYTNLTAFFIKHKWLTTLFAFFLFISIILFTNIDPSQTTKQTPQPTPTPQPDTSSEQPGSKVHDDAFLYNESDPLVEKTELLPDGTTQFTMTSPNPDRPNIVIVKGEHQDVIFERQVILQIDPQITLTQYLEIFGQPTKIFNGSRFWGANAKTYFYQENPFVYIADPDRDRILEIQTIPYMTADEYVAKYGQDIIEK
jgi:hypothetical protein